MVFSSVPVYLDAPSWNQQFQPTQQPPSATSGPEAQQLPPPPLAAGPRPEAGPAGSVRPGSMADRARLAKLPQPEAGLKCPRCESTNTKFCYFNNYSLSQPRHFCKTCRRYWTRGGALRNVPVGGGCRRNKRSKSSASSSKSTSSAATDRQAGTSSTSSTATGGGGGSTLPAQLLPPPPQFPFMASLHSLTDYSGASNLGLGFPGIQTLESVDYQLGSGSGLGLDHWRLPQIHPFPFLNRVEPPPPPVAPPVPGLYPFEEGGGDVGFSGGMAVPKVTSAALITQMASVKMEDSSTGMNMPREFLGLTGNEQYWGGGVSGGAANSATGGGGWTADLAGFNSSSSGNIL